MLHEEELAESESLNLEKKEDEVVGGGARLHMAFGHGKVFYGWQMKAGMVTVTQEILLCLVK